MKPDSTANNAVSAVLFVALFGLLLTGHLIAAGALCLAVIGAHKLAEHRGKWPRLAVERLRGGRD